MRLLTRDLVCQQAVELVTDYLENRLSHRQRKRFERHLVACPNCRTYLEQIRQTIRASEYVATESLDPTARQDLMDLYRRYSNDPPGPAAGL